MPSLSSLLSGFALALMLHAAYSCLHYRSILQDLEIEDSDLYPIPPMDVRVEVVLSFVMFLIAELVGAGTFQSVEVVVKESAAKRRPLMAPIYRTRDFDLYENRSKLL